MKTIETEDFFISSREVEETLRSIFNTILNRLGLPTIVGIGQGALPIMTQFERFCAEFPREKRKPMLATITASSYIGAAPGPTITLSGIPSLHLTFKQRVVLIDDVIDSGVTMRTVARYLGEVRQAKEVVAAALCCKGDLPTWLDESFVGFKLPKNQFIVGAGMDYKGEMRAMPDIRPLSAEEREWIDKRQKMPVEEAPPEMVEVEAEA